MSKQMLIYDNVKPVSKVRHRDFSVKTGDDFSFTRSINSVPVTAIEFPNVAPEYTIVFSGKDKTLFPIAILGVKPDENMYLSADNTMTASYVPAFLRRYPFVYSTADDGATLTLCIDETFSGCNQKNIGERLFDANGEQTMYLKNVLGFLNEYQTQFNRTVQLCQKLSELNLLEPMRAQIRPANGSAVTLGGFLTVSRKRLKELSADQLHSLVKSDALELIYLHLQSLQNLKKFTGLIDQTAG
jgi:hypothetical protein